MSDRLNDIDKIFYDGIKGHAEYPSEHVWQELEEDLDKNMPVIKNKTKYITSKRRYFILITLLASVIVYRTVKLLQQNDAGLDVNNGTAVLAQSKPVNAIAAGISPEATTAANGYNSGIRTQKDSKADVVTVPVSAGHEEISGKHGSDGSTTSEQGNNAGVPNKILNALVVTGQGDEQNDLINSETLLRSNYGVSVSDPGGKGLIFSGIAPVKESEKISISVQETYRPLSFAPTPVDDSWLQDIRSELAQPSFKSSFIPPTSFEKAKMAKTKPAGDSRFSVMLQFFPSAVINVVEGNGSSPDNSGGSGSGTGGGGSGTGGGSSGGGGSNGGSNGSGWGGHHESGEDLKKSEYHQFAYSGGLTLSYQLSRKLSVSTGLNYMLNYSKTNKKQIYADRDNSGNVNFRLNKAAGYADFLPAGRTALNVSDSTIVCNTRNFSSYLSIPLVAQYILFSSGKFSVAALAGGQANILLRGKTTTVFDKDNPNESTETSRTKGLKSSYFSLLTGLTGEMRLSRKLSFTLSPIGQLGLSPVSERKWVKTHTNNFGVAAGLKLKL